VKEMNKLYWAKVKPDAKLPSKRLEDAGYDLYPCFEEDYMEIPSLQTKLIPLGIASAFDPEYVLFLKERGSTGTRGMAQRSGVIDSGYRGEYMAPVTNVNAKPIRIAKKEAVETWSEKLKEAYIIYPYEKAVCQGILLRMPQIESEEITYEELQNIQSERMSGRLGSSGK
jgi:dUTP pyrophosphatase